MSKLFTLFETSNLYFYYYLLTNITSFAKQTLNFRHFTLQQLSIVNKHHNKTLFKYIYVYI